MAYDAIIIGGGAAGLFCALTAGRRGKKVLVLEHNSEVGRKIIISGGGRCNFTNLGTTADNFVSQNPHFAKSALAGYSPRDFVSLVRRHGIEHYEKKLGQLFCRHSSRSIVDMLLAECSDARVDVRTGCTIQSVSPDNSTFAVSTSIGGFEASNLVVACGGLSFPKIGATSLGYELARQFGHTIVQTRPSLVSMVLDGQPMPHLAGVSFDAEVAAGGHVFRENVLFTHRGLSGPAILQISNYWNSHEDVVIDAFPDVEADALLEGEHAGPAILSRFLPQRMATEFAAKIKRPLTKMTTEERVRIAAQLKQWRVRFARTEGYDRAEVTLGGVSTRDLSSQTMMSRKVSGLYFIGEVVDVTGWLGGYNFQWAWASGFAAGNAV